MYTESLPGLESEFKANTGSFGKGKERAWFSGSACLAGMRLWVLVPHIVNKIIIYVYI